MYLDVTNLVLDSYHKKSQFNNDDINHVRLCFNLLQFLAIHKERKY